MRNGVCHHQEPPTLAVPALHSPVEQLPPALSDVCRTHRTIPDRGAHGHIQPLGRAWTHNHTWPPTRFNLAEPHITTADADPIFRQPFSRLQLLTEACHNAPKWGCILLW